MRTLKEISTEIKNQKHSLDIQIKNLPRSDKTRKLQIASTGLENALLWLDSVIFDDGI